VDRGCTEFAVPVAVSNRKGGLGAAVEPTVCNRKVLGSSPSLCILCGEGLALKDSLAQTPHSTGSLRHWIPPPPLVAVSLIYVQSQLATYWPNSLTSVACISIVPK
jgi:hypothetical protein